MPLGTEVGLGLVDIVLDGDPDPPKKGTAPQFSARVYCGQTAVCIRHGGRLQPIGHIALDGDPAPLP